MRMVEVKIFQDGKLVQEQAGDYILLFTADEEKVATFSTGGGPDINATFKNIAIQLTEIIADLGREAGKPRIWTNLRIAEAARQIQLHGRKYTEKLYSEEANERSGQSMGAGVEPGEH